MQAWTAPCYGTNGNPADTIEKMQLCTVPVPEPKAGQVQVKVNTASVNPIDWKLFSGGLHGVAPIETFPYVPGFDVSGTISAVGEGVEGFAVGDRVCVDTGLVETCKTGTDCGPAGAFAEYTCALASSVSKIGDMDFASAAGLPLAGLTAYQALFTGAASSFTGQQLGSLQAGQQVLILGGATAVGAYAVQLAHNAGAHVAATGSSNLTPSGITKVEYITSLGANEVINYKEENWEEVLAGQEYDLIFDTVGSVDDWGNAPKVLKAGGDFVSVANFTTQPAEGDPVTFKVFLLQAVATDLDKLVAMVNEGKLKVPIDSTVPMTEVKEALSKNMQGKAMGKILIKVSAE